MKRIAGILSLICCVAASSGQAAAPTELKSVGPIAFGPNGVLFVSDPHQAAIFAVETGDAKAVKKKAPLEVAELDKKVAELLGTSRDGIRINDLAINPLSGRGYLAVSRGRGPTATPVLLTISDGKIAEFNLSDAKSTSVTLPNAPPDRVVQRGRRRSNPRTMSITDLAYVDGKVLVAGLSNEEFASKLRTIEYPFNKADAGASVEIYHGAHGALETRSPVRTFVPFNIGDTPHVLAAYTCTPLVKFPLSELTPGQKIKGTTVAELGNRNNPLDMVAYTKGGDDYLLIANTARGIMKVQMADVGTIDGITERVGGGGTAGLKYETIEDWKGIVQLEQFSDTHACIISQNDDGMTLRTVALP